MTAAETIRRFGRAGLIPDEPKQEMGDLEAWWITTAAKDQERTVPKTEEYGGEGGSADLQIMGFALSKLRIPDDAPPEVGVQAACWFYALGKLCRGLSDFNHGQLIKGDSTFDLTVYSMMMRRIAETGQWP